MMLSLLVIFFICAMIWMWANQGLFSAFIHLVLTVIAGCAAFALWEPFVYGFLINRMPEQAWGLGLLIPFAVSLIAMRTVFDKVVPGNLNFHNIADNIGGAVCGYLSGMLTAGLLLLGGQMVGMPSLFGYQGYEVDESGKVKEKDSLLIPVDSIAGGFFTYLSGGSMNPILGDASLAIYHPNLAAEASLFHQSPFWKQNHDSSLRALSPTNVKVVENTGLIEVGQVPRGLKGKVTLAPTDRLIAVGTEVSNKSEAGTVSADAGGIFRIGRNQAALAVDDGNGRVQYYYPTGYIQDKEHATFQGADAFAFSGASGAATFHWLFQVPAGSKPLHLTLKNSRIELPEQANTNVALLDGLVGATEGLIGEVPPDAGETPTTSGAAVVDSSLGGARINKNKLDPSVQTDNEGNLLAGNFRYIPDKEDRFLRPEGTVWRVYHAQSVRVVRVSLGQKSDPNSLIGKLFKMNATAVPELVASNGVRYAPIGYLRREGAAYIVKINPNNRMSKMADLELGAAASDAQMFLFFHVDLGKTILTLNVDKESVTPQPLNLNVR